MIQIGKCKGTAAVAAVKRAHDGKEGGMPHDRQQLTVRRHGPVRGEVERELPNCAKIAWGACSTIPRGKYAVQRDHFGHGDRRLHIIVGSCHRCAPSKSRAPSPDSLRPESVSYTHLRAHETPEHLVCRLLLEK